jgi:hypothetical protein
MVGADIAVSLAFISGPTSSSPWRSKASTTSAMTAARRLPQGKSNGTQMTRRTSMTDSS